MKKAETGGKQGQTVANTGNVRPNVHLGSFGKRHSSEPYPQRFQDSRLGREGAEDQRKMTTMRQTDTPDRKTEQAEHVENTTAQILAEKMGPSPARWRRGGASELLIVAQNPGQKGHSRGQNQAHVSLASLQRKKKKKKGRQWPTDWSPSPATTIAHGEQEIEGATPSQLYHTRSSPCGESGTAPDRAGWHHSTETARG